MQWELEEYKMHTQEQMERLNQQKREIESEIFVKDNELKKLRMMQASSGRSSLVKGVSHTMTNRAAHTKTLSSFVE